MTFPPQISAYHCALSPEREYSATHLLTSCSSNLQVMAVTPGTWLPNQGLLRSYFGPVQLQLCLQTVAQYEAPPFFRPASRWKFALILLSSPLIPPSLVKSCSNHQVFSGFLTSFVQRMVRLVFRKCFYAKKRRLNNERSPRSALIGNRKWFSATDASLLFQRHLQQGSDISHPNLKAPCLILPHNG